MKQSFYGCEKSCNLKMCWKMMKYFGEVLDMFYDHDQNLGKSDILMSGNRPMYHQRNPREMLTCDSVFSRN